MKISLAVVLLAIALSRTACTDPKVVEEEHSAGLTDVQTIWNDDVQITSFNLRGHLYFIARPRPWEGAALMHDPDCPKEKGEAR